MSERLLKRTGGTISYEIDGQGPLVIAMPGMGDLRQQYRYLAPQLTAAGYQVASMDIRGHGDASVDWPDYSIEALGSDLLALIAELESGPAVLVGNSMAAGAAVWAAAEAPEQVTGLVLLGPAVRGDLGRLMQLLFATIFARPWGPNVWRRFYATLYPSRKPADFAQYSQRLRAMLQEPGRLEALKAMMAASKAGSEMRLAQVTAPVQVIMGSRDPDFKDPEAEARWVAGRIKGSLTMVPGAGHYPHVEMPEVVGPAVLSFLNQLQETKKVAYVA